MTAQWLAWLKCLTKNEQLPCTLPIFNHLTNQSEQSRTFRVEFKELEEDFKGTEAEKLSDGQKMSNLKLPKMYILTHRYWTFNYLWIFEKYLLHTQMFTFRCFNNKQP